MVTSVVIAPCEIKLEARLKILWALSAEIHPIESIA